MSHHKRYTKEVLVSKGLTQNKNHNKSQIQNCNNESAGGHLNTKIVQTYSIQDIYCNVVNIPSETSSFISDDLLSVFHVHV